MKALFVQESGAGYLLLGLSLVSAIMVTTELTTRYLDPVRGWISVVIAPAQAVAELPYRGAELVGGVLATNDALRADNATLKRRILELSQLTQQYPAIKAENERLRGLLGSRDRLSVEVLVAEVVGVVTTANTHQVIIDRGLDADLAIGQAVIDADGLFGQIVEVGPFTSRVLMISDHDHAVPVEVVRNGIRSIASGTGRLDQLDLEHVPVTADIRQGDLLVSSGLGGHFPKGYPVGRVSGTVVEPTDAFAQVTIEPLAALDRTRELLVLFDERVAAPGPDAAERVGDAPAGDAATDPVVTEAGE